MSVLHLPVRYTNGEIAEKAHLIFLQKLDMGGGRAEIGDGESNHS